MTITELRALSESDLVEERRKLQEEKFKLMMQKGSGRLTKNHMFKQIKKTIARINTILNESR